MNITIKIVLIALLISAFGFKKINKTNVFRDKSLTESDGLPSGFYLLNDSLGLQRRLQGTDEYYFVKPKSSVFIGNICNVKLSYVKTKVFKKSEKHYGFFFKLDQKGRTEFENISKVAMRDNQKLGLIIQDQLLIATYVNTEITDGSFFIEIDTSKDELKVLLKIIKTELNKYK
ncbi:hypothetical protein [Ascidiimonas sp. W6]|uniref:hypothetical protein n=1 Tax=Ascidiimonas meishanensis TaxID=3128903 RepID=UPI0030EEA0EB